MYKLNLIQFKQINVQISNNKILKSYEQMHIQKYHKT